MHPIERAISLFSPQWALKRAYFRSVLESTQKRSYTAAAGGRRGDGWKAPGTSANIEIGIALHRLRNRARELVRNNPYAAGYPGLMASKIVGKGIIPRLALSGNDNKDQRAKAKGIWDLFSDNCDPEGQTDFYGLQSLVARTVAESGEAIVRTIRPPASARRRFPLQIVVQEGDFIDSNKTMYFEDSGNIAIQGVEYDQGGQRVAYWLFNEHPGESFFRFTRGTLISQRVDAADVDHVFDRWRPGQVRGIPAFAAVAMKMRDLDDFDDAELMRKKIASCFAAFVTRPNSPGNPLVPNAATDDKGRRIEEMSPGLINYLQAGEDVKLAEPPGADSYTDYALGQLYAVAAGLGCTFEQLTGYLKGVNFSSIRVGENRFQDLLDHLQNHVYIPQMCRKTWNRVGQVARITGLLGMKDPWEPCWIPPRRRWVDPATDVAAALDAGRAGLIPIPDLIAQFAGDDMESVIEENAQFFTAVDVEKQIYDIDPRKVGKTSTPAVSEKQTTDASAP